MVCWRQSWNHQPFTNLTQVTWQQEDLFWVWKEGRAPGCGWGATPVLLEALQTPQSLAYHTPFYFRRIWGKETCRICHGCSSDSEEALCILCEVQTKVVSPSCKPGPVWVPTDCPEVGASSPHQVGHRCKTQVDEEEKTQWVCCWLVNFVYKIKDSFF